MDNSTIGNVFIGMFWVVMFFLTYPALLANFQAILKHRPDLMADHLAEDRGVAMMFALFPPMWLMAPFLTGFYKHGFKL